jgi:hypothetical protein
LLYPIQLVDRMEIDLIGEELKKLEKNEEKYPG